MTHQKRIENREDATKRTENRPSLEALRALMAPSPHAPFKYPLTQMAQMRAGLCNQKANVISRKGIQARQKCTSKPGTTVTRPAGEKKGLCREQCRYRGQEERTRVWTPVNARLKSLDVVHHSIHAGGKKSFREGKVGYPNTILRKVNLKDIQKTEQREN